MHYYYLYMYYVYACMYILYSTHTYARLKEYVSYHVINTMPAQIKELGKVENTFEGKLLPRRLRNFCLKILVVNAEADDWTLC